MSWMIRLFTALGALFLASATILTGCSHVREQRPVASCAGIDWWETGRTDGVSGLPMARLESHRKRCEGAGVDVDLYSNGRDAGLIDYCTIQQGLAAGRTGVRYESVCPSHLENDFLKAYDIGRRLSTLDSRDSDLEARIENLVRILNHQQGGPAVRAQLDQLRTQRADLISEMSQLELQTTTQ